MNWLRSTFPPSSYVGNLINELKSELRAYGEDPGGLLVDNYDLWNDGYDKGWYQNTEAIIERLETLQEEIQSLEG